MRLDDIRDANGKLPAYAWPGGYDIVYHVADGGTLCAACANGDNGSQATNPDCQDEDQWRVVAFQTADWIESETVCDHCHTVIVPAPEDCD